MVASQALDQEHTSQAPHVTSRRLHQAPPVSSLNFTTFRSAADGSCLTVQGGNLTSGAPLIMDTCVDGNPAQLFSLPRPGISMLVYVGNATTLCVRSLSAGRLWVS
jgi:hypothetical protein